MKAYNHPNNNKKLSKSIPHIPITRLKGHDGPIHMVRFTADGKYCISASQDRTIRLWNPIRLDPSYPSTLNQYLQIQNNNNSSTPITAIPPALQIQIFNHTHPVSAVAIDKESSTIVSGTTDKSINVIDVMTQNIKRKFYGHSGRINAVDCTLSSEAIVSASYDGTVRIWDGRSFNRDPIQILDQAKDSVSCVHILQTSSTTQIVSSSIDGSIRIYDLRMGEMKEYTLPDPIPYFNISNDNKCIVLHSLNGGIYLLEKESGTILNSYSQSHVSGTYAVECTLLSNDEYVLSGSEDGKVVLYDLVSGKMVQLLEGHTRPTCSVCASPKKGLSSLVVSGSFDGDGVVWGNLDQLLEVEKID